MNRMVKKFMVVLLSVFMFMGAVTTPVQAKGYSSDTYGWGGWWSWWWWPTQPAEPEPEPEEEPVVEEEPVAEAEPAETEEPVVEEETPVVTEEPVIEEEPIAEPEQVYAEGTVYDESEHFTASVTFDATAKLPEGTDVSVNELQEGTEAYAAAVKAVFGNEEAAADFIAVDIALVNDDTVLEPDPNGNEVIVSVELKNLPTEAIEAADTMEIQHINETSGETETVATAENITITGENSAEAEFAVGSFSTFVLKWGTEEAPESATIHWGYMDGTEFVELKEESVVTMDTTASTISLANSFEGYTYLDALYCAPGKSVEEGVDIGSTLYKTADGWECDAYSTDGEETTSSRAAIVDGSDIYVLYFIPGSPNPSGASDNTIPSPTTTKTVVPNGDGTYTIQLDIAGATVTEDNSHYANTLVILDATKSMEGTKWTNAKAAMKTLIETLTEGENAANAGKIDFALVTFGRSATVTQGWTKNNTAFKTTCANLNMVSTSGTNWEAGMRGGLYGVLNTYPEGESEENHDPTYVIFLTDGDPNVYYSSGAATNYTNNGTTNGWSQNSNTSATHSADEAKAIAAKTKLYGIYCGSSGTTPSGNSYNRLVNVISGNGQGGQKTIAANADTIESEFKAIAQTMLDDMGSTNVSVDDGITGLSSISANVAGEAGGYEYYKSTDGTDFTKWDEAPGATYSKDNGVTWDLSSAGTLLAGTTYRIKFTVWPSQDAYDLLADLNNGIKTLDNLEDNTLDQLQITIGEDKYVYTPGETEGTGTWTGGKTTAQLLAMIEEADSVDYSVLTNNHLNTTYTFNNKTYTDYPNDLVTGAMILEDTKIGIEKVWENAFPNDPRTARNLKINVTKDGVKYLENIDLVYDETTKKSTPAKDIYISCGVITKSGTSYKVKEKGHEYTFVEPDDYGYYWDLTAEVYRPMMVNGELTMLIKDANADGTEGTNYYVIDGTKYKVVSGAGSDTISAKNERRSHLDLTKIVDGNAPADELFPFTVTFKFPKGTSDDHMLWFSVQDKDGASVTNLTGTGFDFEPSGSSYYSAEGVDGNGVTVKINIKAGWNVRFFNTPKDSTYTIKEDLTQKALYTVKTIDVTGNGESVVDTGEDAIVTVAKTTDQSGRNVDGTATGRIASSGVEYKATFTNAPQYFFVYHSSDNTVERIAMNDGRIVNDKFNLVDETKTGYLYGGYFKAYSGTSNNFDAFKATYTNQDSGEFEYNSDSHPTKGDWYKDAGTSYDGSNASAWKIKIKNSEGIYVNNAYTEKGTEMTPVAGAVYYLKEVPDEYFRPALYYTYDDRAVPKALKKLYLIVPTDDGNYKGVTSVNNNPAVGTLKKLYTKYSVTPYNGTAVNYTAKDANEKLPRGYITVWDGSSLISSKETVTWTPSFITMDGVTVTAAKTRTIVIGNGAFVPGQSGSYGSEQSFDCFYVYDIDVPSRIIE